MPSPTFNTDPLGTFVIPNRWISFTVKSLKILDADAAVICKNGNLDIIYNPDAIPGEGVECDTKHEQQHIEDYHKRYGENVCKDAQGNNHHDGDQPSGGENYEAFRKQSECDAYQASLDCLREKLCKYKDEPFTNTNKARLYAREKKAIQMMEELKCPKKR